LDIATTSVALDLKLGLGVVEVLVAVFCGVGLTDHLGLADLVDLVEATLRVADVDGLLELRVTLEGAMLAPGRIISMS
jgi:hypothetical protein